MSAGVHGRVWVEGIGFWASRIPGWDLARQVMRGDAVAQAAPVSRPAPAVLAPTERRRASDSVALALEVAMQACQSAGRDPRTLPAVFASTHGDLAITDHLCSTLAATPALLSPTKFHNSVHNAAAGYWSIGTGSTAPYTACAADVRTFAAGLLEAFVQVASDDVAVLFVAYDVEARGPLRQLSASDGLLGMAMVISPNEPRTRQPTMSWRVGEPPRQDSIPRCDLAALAGNAMAAGLPLMEALALDARSSVALALSSGLGLAIDVAP